MISKELADKVDAHMSNRYSVVNAGPWRNRGDGMVEATYVSEHRTFLVVVDEPCNDVRISRFISNLKVSELLKGEVQP